MEEYPGQSIAGSDRLRQIELEILSAASSMLLGTCAFGWELLKLEVLGLHAIAHLHLVGDFGLFRDSLFLGFRNLARLGAPTA